MDVPFDWRGFFWDTWEANRRLTLRVARAFPAEALMAYAPVEPLRPFARMLDEVARMETAYMRGLAEDVWKYEDQDPPPAADAAGAIALVERAREYTRRVWPRIGADVLTATRNDPFFFGADARPIDWLQYLVENEVHHRGQGYVYLRQLGIEPPPFYDRS